MSALTNDHLLMQKREQILHEFSNGNIGSHRAVREGKWESYSIFLDEYFLAGYKYPNPNPKIAVRDEHAFDLFIKAAKDYDAKEEIKESSRVAL